MEFTLKYQLVEKSSSFCPSYPQLTRSTPIRDEITFETGCGDDGQCTSDVTVKLSLVDSIGLQNIDSVVEGFHGTVSLKIMISNAGENAHSAKVMITVTPALKTTTGTFDVAEINGTTLSFSMDVGNPLEPGINSFLVPFDLKSSALEHPRLNFTCVFSTRSGIRLRTTLRDSISIAIRRYASLQLLGYENEPTFFEHPETRSKDYERFTLLFTVIKSNYSSIRRPVVSFNLPISFKNSIKLIYKPRIEPIKWINMESSDSSEEEFFDAPGIEDDLELMVSGEKSKKDGKSCSQQLVNSDSGHYGDTGNSTVISSIITNANVAASTIVTSNPSDDSNCDTDKQQQLIQQAQTSSNDPCFPAAGASSSSSSSPLPKPPPRRKKKPTITVTKTDINQLDGEDHAPEGCLIKNANTCLTTLVDEIASIQGDLSVNHDFPIRITNDHSCSVEELSSISDQQSDREDEDSPDVTLREEISKEEIVTTPTTTTAAATTTAKTTIESTDDDRTESSGKNVEQLIGKEQEQQEQEQQQKVSQNETDDETKILEQITILNKDTGECRPLSQAEDILPKCINPLNPHLSKLANDYQSDEDETLSQTNEGTNSEHGTESGSTLKTSAFKNGVKKLGKFGHGFIKGVKQVRTGGSNRESVTFDPRTLSVQDHEAFQQFKLKTNRKKDVIDFDGLRLIQELNDCRGAIWCMKWSSCGQLLAVAGQDQLLRVYCSHKAWKYFTQLRSKASGQQISPNSTKERSLNNSRNNSISSSENVHNLSTHSPSLGSEASSSRTFIEDNSLSEEGPLLLFSAYRGHTADVLDISWSKNNFLLSSSMDKTVKLWHITRVECLCTFCHKDFVTTINFHPRDDRYFLSGSLDGVLRLWNIPDKRLTLFNEVMAPPTQTNQKSSSSNKSSQETSPPHGLITASAFVENGKFAVIGTYDGRVIFYSTDQLKYSTQIHVSGGGKSMNSLTDTSERKKKRNSNKVTGIEGVAERKILVTTNDSRIRLYDLRDLSLACKYKGCVNYSSQIRASVSPDNKYIICGSENSSFYIWRLREETTTGQRRDRNHQWESVRLLAPPASQAALLPPSSSSSTVGSSQASTKNQPAIVTSATFAPNPSYLDDNAKYVIAIADFNGGIKVFSR